jgi:hypothetical protein
MGKRRREMREDVTVNAVVPFYALVDQLTASLDSDDLIALIIAADEEMADWDFTLKLCDHFEKLRKEHRMEAAEDGHLTVHVPGCDHETTNKER